MRNGRGAKSGHLLNRNAPNVGLIVNADVPGVQNLSEGRLDLPAIRIFEGRNFIDPSFGIAMTDTLQGRGVEFHLSAARSGSQTLLFTPLAPTLSIALPAEDIHLPLARMSLREPTAAFPSLKPSEKRRWNREEIEGKREENNTPTPNTQFFPQFCFLLSFRCPLAGKQAGGAECNGTIPGCGASGLAGYSTAWRKSAE